MTFADRALAVIQLLHTPGATTDETIEWFRIQSGRCADQGCFAAIVALSQEAVAENFGTVELNGAVGGPINLTTAAFDNVRNDNLVLIIRKRLNPQWNYFLSNEGAIASLNELATGTPKAVWVAAAFESFATGNLLICPWGGPQQYAGVTDDLELPRKLVRDQTHMHTASSVIPWLLVAPPAHPSLLFTQWRTLAGRSLAFALPFEIRAIDGANYVILKGPRAQPIAIAQNPAIWNDQFFLLLVEAVRWVYFPRRDAEAKFLFLNRELSLGWRDADTWPGGLAHVLRHSLTSARDEFAFYLQDQSGEALKSLAELRKGLQEEVAKTQQATRDLLAALWRDFAVAALVLALRSPPIASTTILHPEVLRLITLAAAGLLMVSLMITIISNARFYALSNHSRADWRIRLYAFLSDADWNELVENQLRAGRWVYRAVVAAMIAAYLVAVLYLINLAEPGLVGRTWAATASPVDVAFSQALTCAQQLLDWIRVHI
jgi:hypothetical protein